MILGIGSGSEDLTFLWFESLRVQCFMLRPLEGLCWLGGADMPAILVGGIAGCNLDVVFRSIRVVSFLPFRHRPRLGR